MDDLISRQAAIDRIQGTGYADAIKNNLMLILRLLPSAQPERNREMVALDMWSVLDHRRDDGPYVMGSEPQIEVTYDEQKRR